jgi:hypothetical protein
MPQTSDKNEQASTDDYIRIHTSDTATFKRCRTRWDWTSPNRGNLRAKVTSTGINFNLAFGTGIHYALEKWYEKGAVPSSTFDVWWKNLEKNIKDLNEGFWIENADEFARHLDLGIGMMKFYIEHYQSELSEYEVVSTEHSFAVDTGLTARDPTTGKTLPVMYCGRMDLILRHIKTGKYGVMDHKTSSRHGDDDFLLKLDMDEQVTRYMWAAQKEAQENDLPYKKIDFVVYNILYKAYPKPPSILEKSGNISINRQTESTTAELFKAMVLSDPMHGAWFQTNEKAQSYYQYLADEGVGRFVHRELVRRNDYELDACGKRILLECQDMLAPDLRIYPNATGEWYCLRCPFRSPCIAALDGSDVDFMLETNYESNMDNEGHYTLGIEAKATD